MAIQLTTQDARQSLNAHVAAKGAEVRARYGPAIGWRELLRIVEDREVVRYPCEIVFDAAQLLPGEFAQPAQKGGTPEEGFTMFVHPLFMAQLDLVPALVLYQLVALNYGVFASSDDAETFGASALGLTRYEYYALICDAADQLATGIEPDVMPEHSHAGGCGGDGCSCG